MPDPAPTPAPRTEPILSEHVEPLPVPADLEARARDLGVEFDPGDADRLALYLALLLDANARVNLTSITDPGECWTRHILDSLTLAPYLAESPEGARVADVGSGGGTPGLVLAILFPRLRFTLIESTGKKAAFLREAAARLGCTNVEAITDRAETLAAFKAPARESFDVACARALGRLNVALELVTPLVKRAGLALFIKGAHADEEITEAARALDALRLHVADVAQTPTGRIVVVEKLAPTPRLYPRRPGEPKRAPL